MKGTRRFKKSRFQNLLIATALIFTAVLERSQKILTSELSVHKIFSSKNFQSPKKTSEKNSVENFLIDHVSSITLPVYCFVLEWHRLE